MDLGHSTKPDRVRVPGQSFDAHGGIPARVLCKTWSWALMTLESTFKLRIFHDSILEEETLLK